MVFQKFALIAVDLALLLALAFSLALVAGAGLDNDDKRKTQREGIRGRGRNEYGREDMRMLGNHDPPSDEAVMFVMQQTRYWRDISDPHTNYCLTYGVTNFRGVEIYDLKTKPCDASDKEQQWMISSPFAEVTRIESKAKSNMCITKFNSGTNAQLKECGQFERQEIRLVAGSMSTPTFRRMIRLVNGPTLAPLEYSCETESHSLYFFGPDRNNKWDILNPEEYLDPPSPNQLTPEENAELVFIVSEHNSSKCVSPTSDLQVQDCDMNDDNLVWYKYHSDVGATYTLWNPVSRSFYTYSKNKGLLRGGGSCCYQYGWGYKSEAHFHLLNVENRNNCGTWNSRTGRLTGFLLIPVQRYVLGWSPKKPKNVKIEDYVQLKLTSSESPNPLCLIANLGPRSRRNELDLASCGRMRYEVGDSELFFLDGDVDGGVFRIRSKDNLRMCLDVDNESPRMRPCDDYSSRQHWRYNTLGLLEISNTFWKDEDDASCLARKKAEPINAYPYWSTEIFYESCRKVQASKIGWTIISNDPCSRDEADREAYPKRDYFLFVSRAEPERCWEREVKESDGLVLNWRCSLTSLQVFLSQIFYFEAVDGSGTDRVRIKYREDDSVCMDVNGSNLSTNIFIDMFKKCESENPNQEWTYNATSGEIFPFARPDLCVSSLCPDISPDCSDRNYCGDFCLQECNGEGDQSFDTMTANEYLMMRDYGNGINEDDIVMVVLREDPEYCIKLYDSLELQDVVVSKCKVDNAEEHFAFEQEEKGLRWRSVENPKICVESVLNNAGKKLISSRVTAKDKQHWQIRDDGTIRPATKEYLCVTRNVCKLASPPEKNDNVELIECDADGPKISRQFDFVKPSKYGAYLEKKMKR